MNFCRFYNKSMNIFEKMSIYSGMGFLQKEEGRKNRGKINIFVGILWLIITGFCVLIFGGLLIVYTKIVTATTSKCDLDEDKK